jgi:hypothetical protein
MPKPEKYLWSLLNEPQVDASRLRRIISDQNREPLRQAQLKTMKEFPQPFFWAAYGLTGEP